jgi:hypothetical protein
VTTSYPAGELAGADLVIPGLSALDVEQARSLCVV